MIGLAQVSSCADGRVVDTAPLDEELSTKDRKFPQHKQHQTAEIEPTILALKFPASFVHLLFYQQDTTASRQNWFVRVRGWI